MQTAKDFAIQKFAKDLVDSVDNLDRALAMVPEEKLNAVEKTEHLNDLVSLYDGLKMTESILMATLKKHGLERFDPSVGGEKFNPNEHEATFMTPMEGKEDNTVFHTQQKGFKLNGRILRAAKVGVVKNQEIDKDMIRALLVGYGTCTSRFGKRRWIFCTYRRSSLGGATVHCIQEP